MKTFIRLREELETHSLQESPFGDRFNMQGRAKDAHKKHNEMIYHHERQKDFHYAAQKRAEKRGDKDAAENHEAAGFEHHFASEAHKDARKALDRHDVDHKKYKDQADEAHHLSKQTEDY